MATVEVRMSPRPEHARTARLLVASLARRAGVDEALLDEIKLAVGEAAARAVGLNATDAPATLVVLLVTDERGRFTVTVRDAARVAPESPGPIPVESALDERLDGLPAPAELALAVIDGLVDDLSVGPVAGGGGEVRMGWPAPVPAPAVASG